MSRNTVDDVASAAVLQRAGSTTAFADLGSSRNAGRANVVCGAVKFDRRARRRDVSGLSVTVFEVESDQGKHKKPHSRHCCVAASACHVAVKIRAGKCVGSNRDCAKRNRQKRYSGGWWDTVDQRRQGIPLESMGTNLPVRYR